MHKTYTAVFLAPTHSIETIFSTVPGTPGTGNVGQLYTLINTFMAELQVSPVYPSIPTTPIINKWNHGAPPTSQFVDFTAPATIHPSDYFMANGGPLYEALFPLVVTLAFSAVGHAVTTNNPPPLDTTDLRRFEAETRTIIEIVNDDVRSAVASLFYIIHSYDGVARFLHVIDTWPGDDAFLTVPAWLSPALIASTLIMRRRPTGASEPPSRVTVTATTPSSRAHASAAFVMSRYTEALFANYV
jgi:hypothetical protein